jgi:hypothetical protein
MLEKKKKKRVFSSMQRLQAVEYAAIFPTSLYI